MGGLLSRALEPADQGSPGPPNPYVYGVGPEDLGAVEEEPGGLAALYEGLVPEHHRVVLAVVRLASAC